MRIPGAMGKVMFVGLKTHCIQLIGLLCKPPALKPNAHDISETLTTEWYRQSVQDRQLYASSVASPKILWGCANVWFQANNNILFGIPSLKAQNDKMF